jgi:hypothetical protein
MTVLDYICIGTLIITMLIGIGCAAYALLYK